MSVNTWNRTEKRELDTLTKSIELAAHTIQCCENEKIFPKRHRLSITVDLIRDSKEVVKLINKANERDNVKDHKQREHLQRLALDTLNDLEMDLQIAYLTLKPNIPEKKLESWLRLIDETKTLLKRWTKQNLEDYLIAIAKDNSEQLGKDFTTN